METITNMKLPDCSICSLPFTLNGYLSNSTVRIPLLLQCAHPACENCIISHLRMKNFITCLVCKKVSYVLSSSEESDILSQFPIDNTLCGLCFNKSNSISIQSDTQIGFIKPVMKQKLCLPGTSCNECQEERAEQLCKQCNAPYCSLCFNKVHNAARALRDHSSTTLNETASSINDNLDLTTCGEHDSHNLELFCIECDVAVCSSCLVASHNGHKVEMLLEKNKEFRDSVIRSYVKVSNIQRRLKTSKKETKQLLSLNKKKDSTPVEIQVRDYFLRMHGFIALHQNKLMNQIKAAQSTSSLNDIMSETHSYIEDIDNALHFTKSLLSDKCMNNVNYKNLLTLLKSKETIPCFILKDSVDDNIIFNYDPTAFDNLEEYCTLTVKQKSEYKLVSENDLPENFVADQIEEISVEDVEAAIQISTDENKTFETSPQKKSQLKDSLQRSSSNASSLSTTSVSSSVSEFPSSLLGDELVPGCSVQVTISHLVSPSDFYVHRLNSKKKFMELNTLVRKHLITSKHFKTPANLIVKGCVFLMYSEIYNTWTRVRVLEINKDRNVNVLCIDYGTTEIISKDKLKTLPTNIKNIPPLALRCKLANCQPIQENTWDPQAVAIMTQITNSTNDPVIITVIDKTQTFYEVDIVKQAESCTFSVADTLIFLNLAVTSAVPNDFPTSTLPARVVKTMPSKNPVKQGSILEVTMAHIVDPGHFYVVIKQGSKCSRKIINLKDDMQRSYSGYNQNRFAMFNPRPGMYVAARYSGDKKWYRAEVLSIPHSKTVKVYYIDYGNTEILSWKNVKILLSKYYYIPPMAYRSRLSDIEPNGSKNWNEDVGKVLEEETRGLILKGMVESVKEDAISIVLYKTETDADICINALLVRNQQAISTGVNSSVVEFPKLYEMPTNDNTYQCDVTIEKPTHNKVNSIPSLQIDNNSNDYIIKTPNGCLKIQVNIKRFVDPGEFYITLCYVDGEIKILEKKLQEHYNNKNIILFGPQEWQKDSRCAAKINDKWFRAIIDDVLPGNHYKIYIPDEGITETVPVEDLRYLEDAFLAQRDGVSKCHLGGLVPTLETWAKTSITEFEEFVKSNVGMLYITKMSQSEMKGNSLPVELFKRSIIPAGPLEPAKDNWTSFNHYLRMIGLAKADSVTKWDVDGNIISEVSQEENTKFCAKSLLQEILSSSFKKVEVAQNPEPGQADINHVAVKWLPPESIASLEFIGTPTYVDDQCNIYIQDFMKTTLTLPQITEDLSKKFDKTLPTPYDLRWTPGDICAAQYYLDKKWYRGLVKKVVNSELIMVQFVDYGNIDPCPVNTLRKKPSMTHIPVQASRFELHTLASVRADGTWEREELDYIHSSVSTKNCRVELEIIPGGYGVKKIILGDGQDIISSWVANGWARYANESIKEYLHRKKLEETNEIEDEDMTLEDEEREEDSCSEEDINEQHEYSDTDEKEKVEDSTNDELVLFSEEENNQCVEGSNHLLETNAVGNILHWSCIVSLNSHNEEAKSTCTYEQLEIGEKVDTLLVEVSAVLSGTIVLLTFNNTEDKELLDAKNEFENILTIMQQEAEKQPLLKKPYKHKTCCAQFSADQKWYRAFVMEELPDEEVLIQYIDYGNVEVLNADKVHALDENWIKPKAQSILSKLHNISVDEAVSTGDIMKKVSACLSKGVLIAKIMDRSLVNTVELFTSDNILAYQSLIDEGVLHRTDT